MKAIRTFGAAVLTLALVAPSSAQTTIHDPGQYSVKVAVDTSLLPIPVPGLPALGPNLYAGTLTVREQSAFIEARFQGTEVDTGDPITVKCRFSPTWSGFTVATVSFGGNSVPDVVTGLDGAALILMKINGVGQVDGFTAQVLAELGSGPSLVRWTVR